MIPVSLRTLISVGLGILLGLLFLLWLLEEFRRSRIETREQKTRVRCRLCFFEFDPAADLVNPCCPRCQAVNQRNLS
jgi:uncharacterized paraquat-inducible protein A